MENTQGEDKIVNYIFRPWRKDPRNGKILWARNYGLRAWKIPICA